MRFTLKTLMLLVAALILVTSITGCDRRTPDERLKTAMDFYKQGDALSAEMEALKVVEKSPDDPAAMQASFLLAQIYAKQNRFEDAEMQLQSVLGNVSQLQPEGKEALRMYLALLNQEKKYDESLQTIDKYQKEYADDPGTSISLTIAGVDVQTMAGKTTAARVTLHDIMKQTTSPAEMTLYRQRYVSTFMRDGNTTAAIRYLEVSLPSLKIDQDKRNTMLALSNLYGAGGNYAKSRFYLEEATKSYMDVIRHELDSRIKTSMALQIAQAYSNLGNLPGARNVYQAVYDSGVSDPQAVMATVGGFSQNLLNLGETSATESLLRDAAKKYPKAPFEQQLQQLEQLVATGQLAKLAPEDTSTLTMKYRADKNVLWPTGLPGLLGAKESTTGSLLTTIAADTGSTISEDMPEPPSEETSSGVSMQPVSSEESAAGMDALTTASGPESLPPLEETVTSESM